MELSKYLGKHVVIQFVDNMVLRGLISDYIEPHNNEDNIESLIIEAIGYKFPIEFKENEIKSIEIIKH